MYLAPLTSLRFVAALFVFTSHLAFLHTSDAQWLGRLYLVVFSQGYIGVTFFFILSGFILSHTYSRSDDGGGAGHRGWSYRSFMTGRIARLVPVHWLTLLLALPMTLWTLIGQDVWRSIVPQGIANALLVHAFFPDALGAFNSPSWSLSVEMFFYALFPFLLPLRSRTLIGLFVVSALFQMAAIRLGKGSPLSLYLIYAFPCSRLGDFVVGMLVWRLYSRRAAPAPSTATWLQAGSVALFVLFFMARGGKSSFAWLDFYFVPPLAAIVLAFAWQQGALARALSGPRMVFLGQASFAFYMVHVPVIFYAQFVRVHWLHALGVQAELLLALFSLVASVGLGAIIFVFYEGPMKSLCMRAMRERTVPGASRQAAPRVAPPLP